MAERQDRHSGEKSDGTSSGGGALRGLASELGVAQPRNVESVEPAKAKPSASTGAQTTDSAATEP